MRTLFIVALLARDCAGLQRQPALISRRGLSLACAAGLVGPTIAQAVPPQLLRDGDAVRCENGTGEACEAAAEGSELIKRLQERSRDNRVRNEADTRARWQKNVGYEEYFAALGLRPVEKPDGTGYFLVPK